MAGDSHTVTRPAEWAGGVIVCSPHSGRDYPRWFLAESCLDLAALRSSEDAWVDRLIAPAVAEQAVTLTAHLPRCLVDLNRGPGELDPQAVTGAPRVMVSARSHAGLGVIPRVVSQGRAIRRAPLALTEAQHRVAAYWRPYHESLSALIEEALQKFGQAVVLDMHSMPRESIRHLAPPLPEVVIGDRHGTSASPAMRAALTGLLMREGFRLRHNAPFAGAFVASHYGRPERGVHVLQVEIDRSLYMDETTFEPSEGWSDLAARLQAVLAGMVRRVSDSDGRPMAAE